MFANVYYGLETARLLLELPATISENTTIFSVCQHKIITLLERLSCCWSGLQLFRAAKIIFVP